MATFSISVKRVPHAPHAVDISSELELRMLDYHLFQNTHIPEEYQEECGALVCAILRTEFHLNERTEVVSKVTLWQPDNTRWFADAKIEEIMHGEGETSVAYIKRGEGETPVAALQQLIRLLHSY